jgi:hypothetical protein
MNKSAHWHLSNIDCLMAHTACLVCFVSTVNDCSKKKWKCLGRCGASSGHTKNLSNLYSLDIHRSAGREVAWVHSEKRTKTKWSFYKLTFWICKSKIRSNDPFLQILHWVLMRFLGHTHATSLLADLFYKSSHFVYMNVIDILFITKLDFLPWATRAIHKATYFFRYKLECLSLSHCSFLYW